jgi:hypothetical protein
MRTIALLISIALAACVNGGEQPAAPDGRRPCLARDHGGCIGADALESDAGDSADARTWPDSPPPSDASSGCAAACSAGPLAPDADCGIVCPADVVERCSACPDGPLVCENGGICAPAPDCASLDAGATWSCDHAGNVCTGHTPSGGSFTCVGPS